MALTMFKEIKAKLDNFLRKLETIKVNGSREIFAYFPVNTIWPHSLKCLHFKI